MRVKLKSGEVIDGKGERLTMHVVELFFLSGTPPDFEAVKEFDLLRDNGELLFDGTGYDTLYKEVEGGYQISNDGSVYVDPPEPEPMPEPVLPEIGPALTTDQRVTALENHIYNNIGG